MEDLYRSLISAPQMVAKQFTGAIFDLATPDGPALVYVDPEFRITASHLAAGFLSEDSASLKAICARIDDGDDPCILDVPGGCVLATQLLTEEFHLGYFMVFLRDYASETVHTNMELAELLLSEAQLICRLIGKNNKLHQSQLVNLSKRSSILSGGLANVSN
ncbi:MAG: hypothetical protein LLF76_14595 [Planctomycetaceae bacterium]|nr:hypothetical protein [Planctomycetaceae bacterium]